MASDNAGPVFKADDIFRFVDFGLGRGIDATNPTPWTNKSSFQVRQVLESNIIGTDEGGALHSYEREVSSVHTMHTSIKSSIEVPKSPITLGIDAEHSHSVNKSRRAIGRRVINRSVSFREDFADVPQFPSGGEKQLDAQQSILTFEERLAQWLVQRIGAERPIHKLKVNALERSEGRASSAIQLSPRESLESLATIIDRDDQSELKILADGCREFVNHFRITHYVSSIDIGAAEYYVLTEEEYLSKVGASGSFGIEKLVNAAFEGGAKFEKSIKISNRRSIGKINQKAVKRGSYEEAVIGYKIRPVTDLIRLQFLREELKKALLQFVVSQRDYTDGPFIISCADDKLFLKVDPKNQEVYATSDIKQASSFFIDPTDEGDNKFEFLIVHDRETKSKVRPISNYLTAPLSAAGRNPGPLNVRASASQEDCRFALHNRLTRRLSFGTAFDLTGWTSGKDAFYINCSRRWFRKNGYVCVRQNRPGSFITACVSSRKDHNNTDTFMLFRLLPKSLDQDPAIMAPPGKDDLEENEEVTHKKSARVFNTMDVQAGETTQLLMEPLKND